MNYLKKSRMYKMCIARLGDDVPAMKDCHYSFHRGYEWLRFYDNEGLGFVQLTCTPAYAVFESYFLLEDGASKLISREFIRKAV